MKMDLPSSCREKKSQSGARMTFPTGSTARRVLQQATRAAHEGLHTNLTFAALLRGDLTRPAYRRLLVCLLGLHQPIEESLGRLPADELLAWRHSGAGLSRTGLLRSDLAALGLVRSEIDATACADALLPPLDSAAAALGCAWVVEGSALGGRIMSGKIDALLGREQVTGGGTFFSSGFDQPARWRGCCEAVEACGALPGGLAAMTSAAATTFAAFEIWLDTVN